MRAAVMGICRFLLLFPFATKPSESRLFPDEMRWVAAGCGRSQVSAQCTHPSQTAAVRCCKAEPGPTSCVSVCDVAQYSGRHSAPVLDGLDGFAASFTEAEAECNSRRMRLCTRAELASNVCCQTGCAMDTLLVWTADDCPATACRKRACAPSTLQRKPRMRAQEPSFIPVGRGAPAASSSWHVIILWPHGIPVREKITRMVQNVSGVRILEMKMVTVNDMRAAIRTLYARDLRRIACAFSPL